MSTKRMTECTCDRCGRVEGVEQVMGADVFPRGWINLTVGLQNRDLCEDCAHGFVDFMEHSITVAPLSVSQSNEAKV